MRADRLVATLLLLQARGQVTAAELARELEVSVSTARRDLQDLSTAGVPVYALRGHGGGWRLLGGARTDLTGLTRAEARALFWQVGAAPDGDPAARSALRKLTRALPEPFREEAGRAARAVLTDPSAWGTQPPERDPADPVLREAILAGRRVQLEYEDRGGARTRRPVDPWGLVDKAGVRYLVAGTDRGRRTFRLDRIGSVTPTGEAAERPVASEDLRAQWAETVAAVEEQRTPLSVEVSVPEPLLPVLRAQFGRHVHLRDEPRGGVVRVRLGAASATSAAEHLAGLGTEVTVHSPATVRAELVRIGHDLVRHHTGASGA